MTLEFFKKHNLSSSDSIRGSKDSRNKCENDNIKACFERVLLRSSKYSFWTDLLGLFLIFGFIFTFELGNRPLATPDEARYVEIPREMVVTGDYLTPRLNGVKYFEKPPLFYWMQAASIKAFGLQEAAMRLWVVLFAILGCLATYVFSQKYFNRAAGIASSLILGSSVLYFSLGRLIILDMPVSVIVTLILYSFYQAINEPLGLKRRYWFYGFSILCGLGVLTKGIMALAIPGPIIILWATYTKQWKNVFPVYLPTSLAVFLAVSVPWHLLVSLNNPEFAYKYFIVEHFMRYTTDVHLRYKPMWFFIPIVIVGFLPWSAFLPQAFRKTWANRKNSLYLFLLLWAVWVFGFFSVSNSKLVPYILPMFPPLAILVGSIIGDLWEQNHNKNSSLIIYSILSIVLCIAGGATIFFFPELLGEKSDLLKYIYTLMSIFFISGLGVLYYLKQQKIAISIIAVSSLIISFTLIYAAPYIQRPSIKSLTEIIKTKYTPGDQIVSFMAYYQDLPVYTQQIVMVVEAKGELEFGTTVEDTTSWMVKEEQFINSWNKGQKMWVIGRKTELEHLLNRHPNFSYSIVAEDHGNVLFTQKF
jgi:4-amino-4-deoxy-L-arabinose transferase-like glycosyltransferase